MRRRGFELVPGAKTAPMNSAELEGYAAYYLDRLDEDAYFALVEATQAILPILVRAFRAEPDPMKRARILEIIWQQRQASAIPVLGEALYDPSDLVWKQALDGLVTLDLPECRPAIARARERQLGSDAEAESFRNFLDEALDQLRPGSSDENNA